MKDTCLFLNGRVRNALREHIRRHLRKEELEEASRERDKEDRYSIIERLIRNAVMQSPIVMFNGVQHVFNGIKYEAFTWSDFYEALRMVVDHYGIKGMSHRRLKDFVNSCMMSINDKNYAVDNTIIVMKNGVYDTLKNELYPFNERFMTNSSVDYNYEPENNPVLWKMFLDRVLPDIEHQALLQEFVAACYVDRSETKIEHMLILKGSGSNGKSVVFETVISMFGFDNVSTFSIADLIGSRREQNIAAVLGKRINYCSEIRTAEIGRSNADAFKSLVSGEPTMARVLYKEPFRAVGIPLMMANANVLPKLGDSSDSIRRRLLIIPFDVTIPPEEQDKELATELKEELPGIFNWAMEGLKRLRGNDYRFYIPQSIASLVEDYVCDNSVIMRWLMDRKYFKMFHPHTQAVATWESCYRLFEDFSKWCSDNHEYGKPKNAFVSELENMGFSRSRRSAGDGFYLYQSLSSDDILKANMDLAIARERKYGIQEIKARIVDDEHKYITGVDGLERYLGLPKDSVWFYFLNGYMDKSYKMNDDGPEFDICEAQRKLAVSGYFTDLKGSESGLRSKSVQTKRVYARRFNERMRMMGEPFRIYENAAGFVKSGEKDTVIVPIGWEYTVQNARKMMEIIKHNAKAFEDEKRTEDEPEPYI